MMKFGIVKKGSTGTDVFILQSLLRALQYVGSDSKPIVIDGQCGSNTVFAIKEFQKRQVAYGTKLRTDGTFDSDCWKHMLGE